MAKGTYLGIGGVPHKVKKMYLGIGGVPRKVKKAYVGVGGVPKLAYSSGLSKITTSTQLSMRHRAASMANSAYYCLIAGLDTSVVEAINPSLVRTNPANLNIVAADVNGATAIDKIIFLEWNGTNRMEAYDSNLVKSFITNSTYNDMYGQGTTSVNGYAMFAGGNNTYNATASLVEAYSSALVKTTLTPLITTKTDCRGASNSEYAFFANGERMVSGAWESVHTVDVYDKNLVKGYVSNTTWSQTPLGISTPDYAFFLYGDLSNNSYNELYNKSLVKINCAPLQVSRFYTVTASIDDLAIIAGGSRNITNPPSTVPVLSVEYYDKTLTVQYAEGELTENLISGGGGSISNKVIFTHYTDTLIEVYEA